MRSNLLTFKKASLCIGMTMVWAKKMIEQDIIFQPCAAGAKKFYIEKKRNQIAKYWKFSVGCYASPRDFIGASWAPTAHHGIP